MATKLPATLRGITRVEHLRMRSIVDPATHCWIWQGGSSLAARETNRRPKIWTFDHATGTKHVMSGPRAVYNIAHGESPPPGKLAYMRCGNVMCVCPAHVTYADNQAHLMRIAQAHGWLKGVMPREVKVQQLAQARKAAGIEPTPKHVVEKIVAAPADKPNRVLAQELGVSVHRVRGARIRAGIETDCRVARKAA